MHFQMVKFYAGQSDGIGAKGCPGGENAHAAVAAQAGRVDRGGPGIPLCLGKFPDQPKMGKSIDTAKCRRVPVFGLKNNGGLQLVCDAALAGNTKFCGKICMDMCNDFHGGGGCVAFHYSYHFLFI